MQITKIHIYEDVDLPKDSSPKFTANFVINDAWLLRFDTDSGFFIPAANVAYWKIKANQHLACKTYDAERVAEKLSIPKTSDELRALGGEDMV